MPPVPALAGIDIGVQQFDEPFFRFKGVEHGAEAVAIGLAGPTLLRGDDAPVHASDLARGPARLPVALT